jgi:putative transposase
MTLKRKEILVNNGIYHIFSRSIAGYIVFNNPAEFDRIIKLIKLCRFSNFNHRYSQFSELELKTKTAIIEKLEKDNDVLVEIIAYCIMPTHIHLLLKQIADNGITKFLGRILNSYSKYFNTKHQRNGPLWSSRFKSVLVFDDEQLLHLTRYIHLNPVSVGLVKEPGEWQYSSYKEYSTTSSNKNNFCSYKNIIDLSSREYIKFAQDQKAYQRELSLIKFLLIDDYTG